MTTASLAIERRFRRRRQLAVFLTLAVVVAVIALAVRYRSEERETSEYLALVQSVAQEQSRVAEGLTGLMEAFGDLERPDIVSRMATLTEQARAQQARLAAATVTRPAATLHGFMSVAAQSWADGLESLSEAVVVVMDQPDDVEDPSAPLRAPLSRLRIGDDAYLGFLAAVPSLEGEFTPPSYPEVSFLGGTDEEEYDAVAVRLALATSLKERRDVSITVNTDPEVTGERNGFPAIPFTGELDITVVVTNAGNVIEEGIDVNVTLTRDESDAEPVSEQRMIPLLEPGSSVPLEFLDFQLDAGALYMLNVTASIADDADPDNNILELLFAVNPE